MTPFYSSSTMGAMENDWLTIADIAAERDCTPQLISIYRGLTVEKVPEAYRAGFVPFPEPDVVVGRSPGWRRSRLPELLAWKPPGPGQGKGGGRPPRPAAAPGSLPPLNI